MCAKIPIGRLAFYMWPGTSMYFEYKKIGYKILIDLLSHFLYFHILTVRDLRSPNTYVFNTF